MRQLFLLALCAISTMSYAQKIDPEVIVSTFKGKSKPTLLADGESTFSPRITRDENGLVGVPKKTAVIRPFRNPASTGVIDPVLQATDNSTSRITAATTSIGTDVNGIGYTSVNPSDPVITVGPNHVVQMINASGGAVMKVFNKDGSQVAAQFRFSNITGVQGAGDPVMQYDQLAKRWILCEFGYSGGITTYVNSLIFAVSVGDDPLGSWYVYTYGYTGFFLDFPKMSVWTDGYYATSNDFNTSGTAYLGSSVYAFDRTKMLAGDPTATAIRTRLTNTDGRYFSMAPVTIEGTATPPVGSRAMFMYYTNDVFTSDPADVDSLYLITMTPDFVTPANTVISAPVRYVPAAFDDDLCTATRGQCIDQQTATGTDLEDLSGRITNRIVYRNFGAHQGLLLNFTVDADGAGKGGLRWMEMRNTGGGWSIFQQSTWAPDANERWLGSMTYDALGNIGLAYNYSGTTANPGIRFTARNPCDPLNTMTLTETTIVSGTNSNGSTRYGDYNALVIDPANDRDFWFTAQHNSGSGNWNTRITNFNLNNCSAAPRVRFYTTEVHAYEDSLRTAGTGCQRYRDYLVNVVIDAPPSQPAIVSFTTSGTATLGSDYTITPASVTLNSSTLSVPVTIRVFADNNVEGVETINVGYTINPSGGNAVADNYNQSLLLKVYDNDPAVFIRGVSTVLLSEGFGTATTPGPTSGTWTISNPNTATNTWVYSANGGTGITTGAAHITNNTTTKPLAYTITVSDTATLRSPLINATAYTNPADSLKLFIRYKCNGELDAGTFYDFGRLRYSLDGVTFINIPGTNPLQGVTTLTDLNVNLPSSLKGTQFYLDFWWQNDNSIGTNPPFTIDSVAVRVSGVSLESTAGSTATEYVTATQPAFFKSNTDGEVIASIANSAHIGCVTGSLPGAGTGRQTATINGASSQFRSDKVVQLTPDNAYSGSYQTTLYLTTAEAAIWGASATSLNILKVPDSDPLGTTITGQVFSTTVNDQRSSLGYISYTGTFSGGFSKFALTNAALNTLPVGDLQFTAKAFSSSIVLNWTTRNELNNRGFAVDRSTDGINFTQIGFVNGRGNSSQPTTYNLSDYDVIKGITYYYRLRQIDLSNREAFSEIRKARIDDLTGDMVLQPNPAHNQVRIVVAEKHTQATISITDVAGKVLLQVTQLNNNNGIYDISINHLPSGTYLVKFVSSSKTSTVKLIKE